MRKFLSLVMMAVLAIGAWAAEETIELTASAQGYSNGELVTTVEGDVVTLTFDKANSANAPAYYTTGDAVRLYNGGTMTVSASGKTMTKVVFEYELNGSATVSVTPATYDASTKTWTGSATEVVMTAGTAKHVRISKVTVTYEDGDSPVVTVATPVIAGETPFTESTQVSITCATTGASIYYTVDGTTPTANSTAYSAPFTLTESATVKAIAYDANNNASSVATKEFVKEEPVVLTNVATVAEFNALADGTDFIFTGNLVATGQTGKYLYAQDSDNGILIYGTIDQTYSDLAEIPGGWTGKKTTFNGAPEAAEPAGLAAATEHVDLAPEEMTPAQVTLENAFKYVVIRGATVTMTNNNNGTITVGDETVALYKRFNVTIPTDDGVYDIIGITGYYNAPQFMPLEFVAQGVDVATPVIEGETPFVGSTTVTITCATDGASIYYTTDGTEPTNQSTAYNAPFELAENTTVKAIAYDANNNASLVASKEFVKTLTVATAAEYLALEDGTEFVFTGNLVVSGQAGQRLYAQDETGGVLIYGNAGQTYKFGDVIPAGFSAKKANYNGTIEMTNMSGMQAATETAELVAKEVAIADYAANQNVYVVVKNATIDGTNLIIGEETLATYNRFGVDYPTDDKAYDVYGVATIYSNAPQLHPISFVEYQEPVVESFISYTAEQANGTVSVVLEDGTPVESLVTKVAEGQKFTVTATAKQGYVVTGIEVKAGEIVITPSDEPYEGEFSAPRAEGSNEMTKTYTMPAEDVAITVTFETATGIDSISMENVKAVRYYNAAGVESATPFQGVNIVVREMTDGSKSVVKVVK